MGVTRLARGPIAAAVVAVALLGVLVGCAKEPGPRPLPSGPIRVTTVPAAPATRIQPSCDQLVPASELTALLTVPVKAVDSITTTAALVPEMSPVWSVREAGGLFCEWSNAPEWGTFDQQPTDYHGLKIEILPQAGILWNRFVSFTLATERNTGCSSSVVGSCSADVHTANDIWLHSNLVEPTATDGAAAKAAFDAMIDRATAMLTASTVGSVNWTPPTGALPPNTPCYTIMTSSGLRAALGVDPEIVLPLDDWTLEDAADFRSGKLVCTWTYGGAHPGVVTISTLGGGSWAWARLDDPRLALGNPQPFSIFGVGPEGGAWMRCNADRSTCATDIVVNSNWVELSIAGTGTSRDPGGPGFDVSVTSTAIAEEIVRRLQGERTA